MLFYQISRLQCLVKCYGLILAMLLFSPLSLAGEVSVKVRNLAGATVKLSQLSNDGSQTLIATYQTSSDGTLFGSGNFTFTTTGLTDEAFYLFEVVGGSDIDVDDDDVIDTLATENKGLLRSIASGAELKSRSQLNLSVLDEVIYQLVRRKITDDYQNLTSHINEAIKSIVLNDISGDAAISQNDTFSFIASDHNKDLSRAYQNNLISLTNTLLSGKSVVAELLKYSAITELSSDSLYDYFFSPDGSRIYYANDDSVGYISTATNTLRSIYQDEPNSFYGVHPSHDEAKLYVLDGNRYPSLSIIDIATGTLSRSITLQALDDGDLVSVDPNKMLLNSDETKAYLATESGLAVVDLATEVTSYFATEHLNYADELVLTSDDSIIYAIDYSAANLAIYDLNNQIFQSVALTAQPQNILLSADEKTLYIANNEAGIAFFDIESKTLSYPNSPENVSSITLTADKKSLILSDYNSSDSERAGVYAFDIATQETTQLLTEADHYLVDSDTYIDSYAKKAFYHNGLLYLTDLDESNITIVDYLHQSPVIAVSHYSGSGYLDDILLSADESKLYATSNNGNIDVFSTLDGSLTSKPIGGNSYVISHNKDKTGLLYTLEDSIFEYDFASDNLVYAQYDLVEDAQYNVQGLAVALDGRFHIAHENKGYKIYNPTDDSIVKVLTGQKAQGVILNSDSTKAYVDYGNDVQVVDLTDNSSSIISNVRYPNKLTLSQNDSILYAGVSGEDLKIVDLANGNAVSTISLSGSLTTISLSRDESYALVGSSEGLHFVDLATHESFLLTGKSIQDFVINKDHSLVYMATGNDGVQVVDISGFSGNDNDGDGIINSLDLDDDNDGVIDDIDAMPFDPNETLDTDNDNIGDNADTDDDGDGYSDVDEVNNGTDPLDALSTPTDTDGDGLSDLMDSDDDGDGYLDSDELANGGQSNPLDSLSRPVDTDGDFISDFTDTDDDNDGFLDVTDVFPLDVNEAVDTDGDGIGNNADTDDDDDLIDDDADAYPLDNTNTPTDAFDLGPGSTNVELGTIQQSYNVMISGFISVTPMTITGGEYSLNGNPVYSTETVMVYPFDDVEVRHFASNTDSTPVTTILTIGDVSDTFSSTTGDATPDAFSFTTQADVDLQQTITSDVIKIKGISVPAKVIVTNGSYQINGAGGFQTQDGFISNEQNIEIRQSSGDSYSEQVDTLISIGGVVQSFSSTTFACDDLSRLTLQPSDNRFTEVEGNNDVCSSIMSGQASLDKLSRVSGALHGLGDEDWYLLDITEPSHYVFTTSGCEADGGGNTLLAIYDSTLTKVAENNDFNASQCSEVTAEFSVGKYAVKVSAGDGSPPSLGDYQLNVQQLYPYISLESEGTSGSGNDGGYQDVEPEFYQDNWVGHLGPDDVDTILITVDEENQRLVAEITDLYDGRCKNNDLDIVLTIFDSNNNIVSANNDRSTHNFCPRVITSNLAIGQYLIVIDEDKDSANDAPFLINDLYGLTVKTLGEVEHYNELENNDARDMLNSGMINDKSLLPAQIVFGELSTNTDIDNFVFEVPDFGTSTAHLQMTLLSDDGLSARLQVFDEQDTSVNSDSTSLEGWYPSLDSPITSGQYIMEVFRGANSPTIGSYKLFYDINYFPDVSTIKTVFGNIPDASLDLGNGNLTSTISIPESCGLIDALKVELDVEHSNAADLAFSLTSPSGTQVQLKTSGTTSGLSGTYGVDLSPIGDLADFKMQAMTGDWHLTVTDLATENVGRLNLWRLNFICVEGDSDSDGMPDNYESNHGLDPLVDDSAEDPDGDGLTNLEEYDLGTNPQDPKPIANAGIDQIVDEFSTVFLNGAQSSDPVSSTGISAVVNRQWTQISGTPVVDITNVTSSTVSFIAPDIEQTVTLTFQYTIKDIAGAFDSDSIDIVINPLVDTDGDGNEDVNDTDDDNDGVLDQDDAFPFDSSESLDTDGDGTGNNKDIDDDNDGVNDDEDAFPLDSTESVDTDGDGDGNNTDTDDDNDNIIDELDGEPLNDKVGDLTAPVFIDIAAIEINSAGLRTDISAQVIVVAQDAVDGEINAVVDGESQFVSGQHRVTVSATDTSGNQAFTTLEVNILPKLNLANEFFVEAAGSYQLPVSLSGMAPSYPVVIEYQVLLNDALVTEGASHIDRDNTGYIPITMASDALTSDQLIVKVVSVSHAFVEGTEQMLLTVTEGNIAPSVTLLLSQDNTQTSVIDPALGLVTITALISDVNTLDNHDITWVNTNESIFDVSRDDNAFTFEFTPELLADGQVSFSVVAIENNTIEGFSATGGLRILIETLTVLSSGLDSDGDGIVDSSEGYRDSDSDGIVDYLDANPNTTQLPSSENTKPIQTSTGLSLKLGTLAQVSQGASAENASLTLAQLTEVVGEDAADTTDADFELFSPIYNFVVTDLLLAGDSVSIVIPLAEGEILPENAIFRKYQLVSGWYTFVEDAKNSLSSAMTDLNGHCPDANDSSYSQGLAAGHNCFQLVIEDGGPNDADGIINGSVEDPGAIVIENKAVPDDQPEPENMVPIVTIAEHLQNNAEGSIIILTAQASDADSGSLSYEWQQVSGPEISFDDVTASQVYITLPEVAADAVVTLQVTVSDGQSTTISETTLFVIDNSNEVTVSLGDKTAGTMVWLLIFSAMLAIRRYRFLCFTQNISQD